LARDKAESRAASAIESAETLWVSGDPVGVTVMAASQSHTWTR